jgi:cysteine desulfurase/selenocysteine lyase
MKQSSEVLDASVETARRRKSNFDVQRIRADFPILSTTVHGKPLIYLDNGATTQKPRAVIDRIVRYYEHENANIHRGVYELSQRATEAYDAVRKNVARFINARDDCEIVFVRGTTEGINLVASSWGRPFLSAGDEIVVSAMEHHSDIVPWQFVAEAKGAKLRVIAINDAGELRMDEYEKILASGKVKLVAVTHLSNALGTINDVKTITRLAHAAGAKVLIDGAQWVAHCPTDVQDVGCDFYTFSGHKLYGPTGVGVLYGRRELLEAMPPFHGGGDMIESVTWEKTTYAPLPNKFEAGTPDIAGVVGLGAAIDYVTSIGFDVLMPYEHELLEYATKQIAAVPGLRIIGTATQKGSVISFVMENPPIAPLDLGLMLDAEGIAVRTGHHCGMPLMKRLGISATTRVSLAMYNTRDELDALVAALKKIAAKHARRTPKAPAAAAVTAIDIAFPGPSGASPQAVADEIAGIFEFLEDRNAKNEQIIDYGKRLPSYFEQLKTLTQRLAGCMAQVYMIARPSPMQPDRFEFVADADADIVRGEIAILQKIYSGQRARDVASFDIEAFFTRIGLEYFLTAQRRTGLASMVRRIRESAAAIEKGEDGHG